MAKEVHTVKLDLLNVDKIKDLINIFDSIFMYIDTASFIHKTNFKENVVYSHYLKEFIKKELDNWKEK